MVRDLESLIEYLYLKSINSELLDSKIIVNPRKSDKLLGKIVIINKLYEVPNLTFADQTIYRCMSQDAYINKKNEYISGVNISLDNDSVFVYPLDNVFYFGTIPDYLLQHPCYQYLFNQISNYSGLQEPIQESILQLMAPEDKAEESSV